MVVLVMVSSGSGSAAVVVVVVVGDAETWVESYLFLNEMPLAGPI